MKAIAQKFLCLFLTLTVAASVCLLPVLAEEVPDLSYILENFTKAELPTISNNFNFQNTDEGESAVGNRVVDFSENLTTSNTGDTLSNDNGRLKIHRIQTEAAANNNTNLLSKSGLFSGNLGSTGLCYFSFKLQFSSTVDNVKLRLSNDTTGVGNTELVFSTSNETLKVRGQSSTVSVDSTQAHKYELLLDYNNKQLWLWIDDIPAYDGNALAFSGTATTTSYFRIYIDSKVNTNYGEIYLDDFVVTPMVAKQSVSAPVLMPSVDESVGYAYEENFDALSDGTLYIPADESAETAAQDTYGFVSDKILQITGNTLDGHPEDMTISDKKLSILGQGAHFWRYSEGFEDGTAINDNLVIQTEIQSSKAYTFNIGGGANASAVINLVATDTGITINSSKSECKKVLPDDIVGDAAYRLTFLICSNNTYSLWIDDALAVCNADVQNVTEPNKIAGINFSPNSTNAAMVVDNIRVFEAADDDFLKVDKILRFVRDYTDFAKISESDGLPLEFSNTVVEEAAGIVDAGGYTVKITDSENFYDGNDTVFPLKASATDVTVSVTYGEVALEKTIADVPMPAAFRFGDVEWGVLQAGDVYDGMIYADARNEATAKAYSPVIAVGLYSGSNEGSLSAVTVATDCLYEGGNKADGFSFSLNLEAIKSLPDNPSVKIFVWDSTDTLFPLTQNYSHKFN